MDLRTRFQITLGLLLSASGTLCLGLGFGLLCVLLWLTILAYRKSLYFYYLPERFSRPILTLLCFGYTPGLAFWGNFTYYTGLPRMSAEEAFWFFNLYTLFLELFLLCSQKTDHVRSFLILIAAEQLISGMVFRPTPFSIFLFLPTVALFLLTIHFRTEFLQAKRSLQLEMKNTCEEMIRHFATPASSPALNIPGTFFEVSTRKTPVILGTAGENEIRERLSGYPIQVKRRRHSLCFLPELETLEHVRVWDDSFFLRGKTAENSRHTVWKWVKKATFWTLGAFLFGLLFFVSIYRPEHFRAGNFGWGMPASIGYSETARLGEFGPQLKNPKPFFWLRLFRDNGSHEWKIPVTVTDFKSETILKSEPDFTSDTGLRTEPDFTTNTGFKAKSDLKPEMDFNADFELNAKNETENTLFDTLEKKISCESDFSIKPIYLRGATFDVYKNSVWENSPDMLAVNPTAARGHEYSPSLIFRPKFLKFPGLIRLEETFEPTTEQTFFSAGICYLPPSEMEGPTQFSTKKDKYQFENGNPVAGVAYSALSHGFLLKKNRIYQLEWTPCLKAERNFAYVQEPDAKRFPALRELATKWTEEIQETYRKHHFHKNQTFNESVAPPENQEFHLTPYREIATEMARKLAHSPAFSYSVNPVRREHGLDPVEDFIRNHPEGHCEFYATALVLMLRSQGIPARYAVGFATQEYSPTVGAWVIRHQDAHAWVEAWIPPEEIPDEIFSASGIPHSFWRFGAWLRLDPTSQQVRVATLKKPAFPSRLADTWEAIWKNYFMNMNFQVQREWIYTPACNIFTKIKNFWKTFQNSVYRKFSNCHILSILVGGILILTTIFWGTWVTYWLWGTNSERKRSEKKGSHFHVSVHNAHNSRAESETGMASFWDSLTALQKRRTHSVTFYHTLEKELAARGFTRKNGETSLEFITEAEEKLGAHGWTELTQKYYKIRFGNHEK
ncbi:MAG: transglutaminase domain-containing protein [Planctomycetia bacterium]|nr:transglutaminase domain-containing protein [Planctomycetia bacterium]